jgi:enamine deaminase RidA (YjgF/YER057c/UK114 family)
MTDDARSPRHSVSSGTPWEALAGYARAVRWGDHVYVSGTTASDAKGNLVGAGDPAEQTRFILRKIEAALAEVGASLSDTVRTRVFVTELAHWEPVARAHGDIYGAIRPANTLVQVAGLVQPGALVEIELDAEIGSGDALQRQAQ